MAWTDDSQPWVGRTSSVLRTLSHSRRLPVVGGASLQHPCLGSWAQWNAWLNSEPPVESQPLVVVGVGQGGSGAVLDLGAGMSPDSGPLSIEVISPGS